MERHIRHMQLTRLLLISSTLAAMPALAYLGPGGAVSSIGALLALIGAVLLAVIGFVWFPLKRMLSGKSRTVDEDDDEPEDDERDASTP